MRFGQEIQALPRRPAASERLTGTQNAGSIHVVAAALIDAHRRVLIAQRPAGKHLAGAWEFPGGKLEPGETPAQALERELREEIGITIGPPRPLLRLHHTYPYGDVLLDVWVVRRYHGRPRGLDGQALRWCDRAALAAADLLPADRPILAALRLPERLRRDTTLYYRVVSARDLKGARRRSGLVGAACRSAAEAQAAARRGPTFSPWTRCSRRASSPPYARVWRCRCSRAAWLSSARGRSARPASTPWCDSFPRSWPAQRHSISRSTRTALSACCRCRSFCSAGSRSGRPSRSLCAGPIRSSPWPRRSLRSDGRCPPPSSP